MVNMALYMLGKQSQLKASMNVYINHKIPITDVPLLIFAAPSHIKYNLFMDPNIVFLF